MGEKKNKIKAKQRARHSREFFKFTHSLNPGLDLSAKVSLCCVTLRSMNWEEGTFPGLPPANSITEEWTLLSAWQASQNNLHAHFPARLFSSEEECWDPLQVPSQVWLVDGREWLALGVTGDSSKN